MQRYSPETLQQFYDEWKRSGIEQNQFCKERGIHKLHLKNWHRKSKTYGGTRRKRRYRAGGSRLCTTEQKHQYQLIKLAIVSSLPEQGRTGEEDHDVCSC